MALKLVEGMDARVERELYEEMEFYLTEAALCGR